MQERIVEQIFEQETNAFFENGTCQNGEEIYFFKRTMDGMNDIFPNIETNITKLTQYRHAHLSNVKGTWINPENNRLYALFQFVPPSSNSSLYDYIRQQNSLHEGIQNPHIIHLAAQFASVVNHLTKNKIPHRNLDAKYIIGNVRSPVFLFCKSEILLTGESIVRRHFYETIEQRDVYDWGMLMLFLITGMEDNPPNILENIHMGSLPRRLSLLIYSAVNDCPAKRPTAQDLDSIMQMIEEHERTHKLHELPLPDHAHWSPWNALNTNEFFMIYRAITGTNEQIIDTLLDLDLTPVLSTRIRRDEWIKKQTLTPSQGNFLLHCMEVVLDSELESQVNEIVLYILYLFEIGKEDEAYRLAISCTWMKLQNRTFVLLNIFFYFLNPNFYTVNCSWDPLWQLLKTNKDLSDSGVHTNDVVDLKQKLSFFSHANPAALMLDVSIIEALYHFFSMGNTSEALSILDDPQTEMFEKKRLFKLVISRFSREKDHQLKCLLLAEDPAISNFVWPKIIAAECYMFGVGTDQDLDCAERKLSSSQLDYHPLCWVRRTQRSLLKIRQPITNSTIIVVLKAYCQGCALASAALARYIYTKSSAQSPPLKIILDYIKEGLDQDCTDASDILSDPRFNLDSQSGLAIEVKKYIGDCCEVGDLRALLLDLEARQEQPNVLLKSFEITSLISAHNGSTLLLFIPYHERIRPLQLTQILAQRIYEQAGRCNAACTYVFENIHQFPNMNRQDNDIIRFLVEQALQGQERSFQCICNNFDTFASSQVSSVIFYNMLNLIANRDRLVQAFLPLLDLNQPLDGVQPDRPLPYFKLSLNIFGRKLNPAFAAHLSALGTHGELPAPVTLWILIAATAYGHAEAPLKFVEKVYPRDGERRATTQEIMDVCADLYANNFPGLHSFLDANYHEFRNEDMHPFYLNLNTHFAQLDNHGFKNEALYRIGKYYLQSGGANHRPNDSLSSILSAISNGYRPALDFLRENHERYTNIADEDLLDEMYKPSNIAGNARFCYLAGSFYMSGKHQNLAKAFDAYFEGWSSTHSSQCLQQLSDHLDEFLPHMSLCDSDRCHRLLNLLAEQKNRLALVVKGDLHLEGVGTFQRSRRLAVASYKAALCRGDVHALLKLAFAFLTDPRFFVAILVGLVSFCIYFFPEGFTLNWLNTEARLVLREEDIIALNTFVSKCRLHSEMLNEQLKHTHIAEYHRLERMISDPILKARLAEAMVPFNHPHANRLLSKLLWEGSGINQSFARAHEYLQLAADANDSEAKRALKHMRGNYESVFLIALELLMMEKYTLSSLMIDHAIKLRRNAILSSILEQIIQDAGKRVAESGHDQESGSAVARTKFDWDSVDRTEVISAFNQLRVWASKPVPRILDLQYGLNMSLAFLICQYHDVLQRQLELDSSIDPGKLVVGCADNRNIHCATFYATALFEGKCVVRNRLLSYKYMIKAVEMGHVKAKALLSTDFYYNYMLAIPDDKDAHALHMYGSEAGNSLAYYHLAVCHLSGCNALPTSIQRNITLGVDYAKLALDAHDKDIVRYIFMHHDSLLPSIPRERKELFDQVAAGCGVPRAMFAVGVHLLGHGNLDSKLAGLEFMKLSIEADFKLARDYMFKHFERIYKTATDSRFVSALVDVSSLAGHPEALYRKGSDIVSSSTDPITTRKGLDLVMRAYEVQHQASRSFLAAFFSDASLWSEPGKVPLAIVRAAADEGKGEAQVELAKRFMNGVGLIRSLDYALDFLYEAHQLGDAEAANVACDQYDLLRSSKLNHERMLNLLMMCSSLRMDALIGLVDNLLEKPTPKDKEWAVQLLQDAVERGSEEAVCRLGDIYQSGKVVPQNLTAAYALYNRATVDERGPCAERLGLMHRSGDVMLNLGLEQHGLGLCSEAMNSFEVARQSMPNKGIVLFAMLSLMQECGSKMSGTVATIQQLEKYNLQNGESDGIQEEKERTWLQSEIRSLDNMALKLVRDEANRIVRDAVSTPNRLVEMQARVLLGDVLRVVTPERKSMWSALFSGRENDPEYHYRLAAVAGSCSGHHRMAYHECFEVNTRVVSTSCKYHFSMLGKCGHAEAKALRTVISSKTGGLA
eukprot:TRINITY_DN9389_c0_g2_i1.p1 TRINITY_DN9389_c0_g2~~TRINITY_DN9389_c0_g2_i1.p1  ORF type:complete len:2080 (-),score=340.43 TRINITY_DN9389_c0_g2_i1:484-6723(-)